MIPFVSLPFTDVYTVLPPTPLNRGGGRSRRRSIYFYYSLSFCFFLLFLFLVCGCIRPHCFVCGCMRPHHPHCGNMHPHASASFRIAGTCIRMRSHDRPYTPRKRSFLLTFFNNIRHIPINPAVFRGIFDVHGGTSFAQWDKILEKDKNIIYNSEGLRLGDIQPAILF